MDRELVESCYTPAALQALKSFPVDAENVELIAQSENVTFRISVRGANTDYVLRLHRPGYNTIEQLNSERVWTQALMEAGMSVPDSLLTRHGDHRLVVPASRARRVGFFRGSEELGYRGVRCQ